jgi:hypothetical protein
MSIHFQLNISDRKSSDKIMKSEIQTIETRKGCVLYN